MARERDQRFASADEVARALDQAVAAATPAPTGPAPARPSARPPAPDAAAKNVAVLPFRNQGPLEDEYIADGLTDDLIDTLSMTRGLRVQARGAVMRFKAGDRDPREVGRQLDVQVVVDGSVRKVGGKLRVNARLVSVADGFQLWAKRFDCPESEFLAVGDEAANAIAEALTLVRDQPAREAPTDPLAIDLLLRARHAYHAGWSLNVDQAIDLFRQALARAPEDPQILAGYALALMRRFSFDPHGTEADGNAGKDAAERALAKAPNLGEARMALATHALITGDGVACGRAVREALAVSPGSADVHDMCGRLLGEVGRPEEALASLRMAVKLEPSNLRARGDAVRMHALLGDYEPVDQLVEHAAEAGGTEGVIFVLAARLSLWKRDVDLLRRLQAATKDLEYAFKGAVGELIGLGLTGQITPALLDLGKSWGKVTGRAMRRPAFFQQLAAEVAAYAGRDDEALDAIEAADRLGLIDIAWLDRCPLFEGLRGSPRFASARHGVAERASGVLDALEGR
jgi:serine/threonine-protein kinase